MNVLVVIPARGGSKGIPRKNLRTLAGKPLIYYAITTAIGSQYKPDVVVSSEDKEILSIAAKIGAQAIARDSKIADDAATLDPVIYDAFQQAQDRNNKKYDIIVTLQPTSPLLKTSSLDNAIGTLIKRPNIETVISAINDTHLTWIKKGGRFVPNYHKRLNRQFLPQLYRETGGFLITRSTVISAENRIGHSVHLELLQGEEAIDIDTFEDWNLCEYYLKRKSVLFVVTGYHEVGLGHVYNTLLIANDIVNHEVMFLVDKMSQLAFEKIASKNYPVYIQESQTLIEDINKLKPDVVINDMLDTTAEYIKELKISGYNVVNFEDLGSGAREADLVINAIYPEQHILPNHYFGHEFFVIRDEFILTDPKPVQKKVSTVLLSFGGVDPNNYTRKVLQAIQAYCIEQNITIEVIAGFGYQNYESLPQAPNINVFRNTAAISTHMQQADIIFTSAGRTTYEAAALHVPTIVMAQNEREMTHFFASSEFGFEHLGLGYKTNPAEILTIFTELVENFSRRVHMSRLMQKIDLRGGRNRVVNLINQMLEEV